MIYPPKLPSMYLAPRNSSWYNGAYESMFAGSAIRYPPKLPATTLTDWCYDHMFQNCRAIKLSETQSEEYHNEYRIPSIGTGVCEGNPQDALYDMFTGTRGSFKGTPTINTTYYYADFTYPQ